jgi:hypothetical protein
MTDENDKTRMATARRATMTTVATGDDDDGATGNGAMV